MDLSQPKAAPDQEKLLGAMPDDIDACEDARLLCAIAEEDQRAVALLYQRRSSLVYSFLMRMLGNRAEAEEVLQDTFIRLWKRAKDYDKDRSSATAWLLMLARGLAMDKLRARARRSATVTAYEREVSSLEFEEITGSRRLENKELAEICRAALNSLPENQSRALQLAFLRGWTHEEIAQVQGEALGTVKARIRRGLIALRKTVKDYYA